MDISHIIRNGIEMYESLLQAVDEAGGSGSNFRPFIKLKKMTVTELIDQLATNKIRFIYIGKDAK